MQEFELEIEQEQEFEIEEDNTPYVNFEDIGGNPRDNANLDYELDVVQSQAINETKYWVNQQGYDTEANVNSKIANAKQEVEDEMPTKFSELENDLDLVDKEYVDGELDNKVDKETGKGLSTNDFTNAEKSKLASLENYDDTEIKQDIQSLDTRLDNAETDIDDIETLIPNEATSTNKLADKEFVNSSITTNTAFFRGTYDVVNDLGLTYDATHEQVIVALGNVVQEKTNNDYVFVYFTNPTTSIIERYDRYKYSTDLVNWQFEYTLNNSSFTAQQWASINSGITALGVAQITLNESAIETLNTNLSALATRVGSAETNITNLQTSVQSLNTSVNALNQNKISKVSDATSGNVPTFKNDGTIEDTGAKPLYIGTGTSASSPFNADTLGGQTPSYYAKNSDLSHETWTFTLANNTTINKEVVLWTSQQ